MSSKLNSDFIYIEDIEKNDINQNNSVAEATKNVKNNIKANPGQLFNSKFK